MAAAHEVQQVVQKLTHIGRADVVLQVKVADPSTEINPEIFFLKHAERAAGSRQQAVAVVVEGGRVDRRTAQQGADPVEHLSGGALCVGKGDDLVRPRMPVRNQRGYASNQDGRLARAGARNHDHRPANVLDGLLLLRVGNERIGRRFAATHAGRIPFAATANSV